MGERVEMVLPSCLLPDEESRRLELRCLQLEIPAETLEGKPQPDL